jgi:penicillin-binding protein activator
MILKLFFKQRGTHMNTRHLLTSFPVLPLILIAFLGIGGCAKSTSSPTVTRGNVNYGDAEDVENVTNEFGSTDLQTIAEAMSRSLLQSKPVVESAKTPLVTVAEVKNKTGEYIDTRAITDTIKTQLMKSGAVKFAVDVAAMDNQTDELYRQNDRNLYKKSSAKKMGQMQGADFRIEGSISSIVKKARNIKDVYYKFTLSLVDIESGVLVWMDEKEIRKTSRR